MPLKCLLHHSPTPPRVNSETLLGESTGWAQFMGFWMELNSL